MTLSEKKELIFRAYETSFDLNLACDKVKLSADERKELDEDEAFSSRIMMLDIEVKEDIITSMRSLAMSENESIKFRATESLGKMLYPERFIERQDKNPGKNGNQVLIIELPSNGR